MVNQLPQGWKEEELGKLADVIAGQSPEGIYYNTVGDGTPFYQGKSEFQEMYLGKPTKWTTKVTKLAKRNDILMSVRAPVGPVNITQEDICIGRGLAAITAKSMLLQLYLFYHLRYLEDKISGTNGAVFASISKREIEQIKITYPIDKEEQDYIVKTLDAVAEIIRLHKETIQLTKDLIPAIFHEMFGDPERKICLADVTTIKGGKRLPYGEQLQDEMTVHPYIRVADMVNNTIKKDKLKYISDVIYNKIQNYTISSKDVYISIAGTIGRVGLVPDNLEGANLTENAAKIVLNENKINKVFLVYELLTDVLQSQIKSLTIQAGVPKLAISRIESLKIYCPPLSEQEEFADKVEQINKYIVAQQEELEYFETLFQSLLQEAFTGVLTWKYPRKENND